MGKRIKKTCILCGEKYEVYCNECPEAINQPVWKNVFCCENCRTIYYACSSFNIGEITKEEAKDRLANCDLSNKDNYTKATKRILDEIFADDLEIIDVGDKLAGITKIKMNSLDDFNNEETAEVLEVTDDAEVQSEEVSAKKKDKKRKKR